jgi:hypothetical protein
VRFEVAAVVAGDGQAPVAERLLRVAAGAEEGGGGVLLRLALGVGDLVEGLVEEGVEALGPAGEGVFEAAGDDRGEGIVGDGLGEAGGDERRGVLGAPGAALAGLFTRSSP